MALPNILITGASGYLGGSLLAALPSASLPPYNRLLALVRTEDQARAVRDTYGATPLTIDLSSEEAVQNAVLEYEISVVFWLIGVRESEPQERFIRALGQLKERRGGEVHFLQTTGAKLFSSLTGHPTDRLLLDTEEGLFDIQKNARGPFPPLGKAVVVNCKVIEECDKYGVRAYIFAPCIVYGQGSGFGNKISIQTVDIVTAAKATGKVHKIDAGNPKWPVCHIDDNTSLYLQILRRILEGVDLGHGKQGYFIAASGRIAWNELYSAMAKALYKQGVIESEEIVQADDQALEGMAKALGGMKETVRINIAGDCTFTAEHGKQIGWQPKYSPEHILESANDEVTLILREQQHVAETKRKL